MTLPPCLALVFCLICFANNALAQAPYQKNGAPDTEGDTKLRSFFREEVGKIESKGIAMPKSAEEWPAMKAGLQKQLREMLLLEPMPEKTDLMAVTTGKIERDRFTVENVHFQSSPGLYVTGNLYLPAKVEGKQDQKAPAILYVCGHASVKKDGVSFGNKVHYQHHGIWFARQGYVCLIIDSVQLGEIPGLHHGTHNLNQWWWACRGYSPAATEAWNCVRALDYLCSRPEVDAERLGVTGRSGGGAYSWWIAAIDDRIKVAAPVAGITDLQDYVVDDCIEGHCDCMFMNNTYQWDYPQVAALVAPRPLIIVNTDSDNLFPIAGVSRTFFQVRELYRKLEKAEDFALSCSPGGHVDSQEVQLAAFAWFNKYLMNNTEPVKEFSEKLFEPEQLQVFKELPKDAINGEIQKTFGSPCPAPVVPTSKEQWAEIAKAKKAFLGEQVFRRMAAAKGETLQVSTVAVGTNRELGLELVRVVAFDADQNTFAQRYVIRKTGATPNKIVLQIMDDAMWDASKGKVSIEGALKSPELEKVVRDGSVELVIYSPPGVGEWKLNADAKERNHLARRALLIGDTLAGMQVLDLVRLISSLKVESQRDAEITISAHGELAGVAVYASIFGNRPVTLDLTALPSSHMQGPILINVLRGIDMPEAVALAAETNVVRIKGVQVEEFAYPLAVQKALGWEGRLVISP
jgi:dienelactone hydrolase